MAAKDGQRFDQQPQHVQDAYRAKWSTMAEAMWDQDHNIEIGQAPTMYYDPGAGPGSSPGVTYVNSGNPSEAHRDGQRVDSPHSGSGTPVPPAPTGGSGSGQQPQQPQRAGKEPAPIMWDGKPLPNGTPVGNDKEGYVVENGRLRRVTDFGEWAYFVHAQHAKGLGVVDMRGRVQEYDAAAAQASNTGGVTSPGAGKNTYGTDGLTPAMLQAVSQQMSQAASAAKAYSDQTGIVHEPSFDPVTQRWTYVPVNDPSTGKPMRTLDAQKFAFDIEEKAADRAYQQLLGAGFVQDPQTGQRLPTIALRQFEEGQRQFNTTFGENQRQFNVAQSGYLDGAPTLDRERFGFDVAKHDTSLKANPRNYIEASMFNPGARGGLGGFAPNNQLPPGLQQAAETFRAMQAGRTAGQSTPQTNAGIAPTPPAAAGAAGTGGEMQAHGGVPAPMAGLPGLGQPGAPDHWSSLTRPDGSRVDYYLTQTEGMIPVTAAQRALMEGQAVPRFGAIAGPAGGWVPPEQVRQAVDPSKWISRDFNALAPSEQAQARALASAAGFSDDDTQAAIKSGLPDFAAPNAGAVLPFKWGAAA